MPTQKQRKQACAYLACAIINTAKDNLDLLAEANEEFGGSSDILSDGAEACDVTIRCYLLSQAIENVAPDMWQDWEDSQEESEE